MPKGKGKEVSSRDEYGESSRGGEASQQAGASDVARNRRMYDGKRRTEEDIQGRTAERKYKNRFKNYEQTHEKIENKHPRHDIHGTNYSQGRGADMDRRRTEFVAQGQQERGGEAGMIYTDDPRQPEGFVSHETHKAALVETGYRREEMSAEKRETYEAMWTHDSYGPETSSSDSGTGY